MTRLTMAVGALAALLMAGAAAPASAQGFCGAGQLGGALCGAGIGGGIGAALGGQKGAQTGAIIGGIGGLLTTPPAQPQPYYQPQPTYVVPAQPTYVVQQPYLGRCAHLKSHDRSQTWYTNYQYQRVLCYP